MRIATSVDKLDKLDNHLEVGKSLIEIIKGEDFFEEVNWDRIVNHYYEIMADNFMVNVKHFLDFIKYQNGDTDELSEGAYMHLKKVAEKSLLDFGYYWDDDDERYRREKTISSLTELLYKNEILFSIRNINELKISNENNFIDKYANVSFNEEITDGYDILITKDNINYVVRGGAWFSTDEQLINYLKSVIETKEEITMENTIECKFNITLNYGEELDGIHIIDCGLGIPFQKGVTTYLANKIYGVRNEDRFVIKTITSGYLKFNIEDINMWFGIDLDNLLEILDKIIPEVEKPEQYIKINNKYYEVKSLGDFLDLKIKVDNDDTTLGEFEYNIYDSLVSDILRDFKNEYLFDTIQEIHKMIRFCDNDEDLFTSIIADGFDLDIINSEDLWIIEGCVEDVAQEYVEKFLEYDNDLSEYIDYIGYFKDQIEYREIDGYVIVEI